MLGSLASRRQLVSGPEPLRQRVPSCIHGAGSTDDAQIGRQEQQQQQRQSHHRNRTQRRWQARDAGKPKL